MKIVVNTLKPRNPLVALARFRRAGSHADRRRSARRQVAREMRFEMKQMQNSP
jgi:hypothetical protein